MRVLGASSGAKEGVGSNNNNECRAGKPDEPPSRLQDEP